MYVSKACNINLIHICYFKKMNECPLFIKKGICILCIENQSSHLCLKYFLLVKNFKYSPKKRQFF